MIWFTSDTHFHHANIIKYCNRPFKDVEEMNETLIWNWNEVVDFNDTVYHLGDFCFGSKLLVPGTTARLNGIKHLILGNHDRLTNTGYRNAGLEPHKSLRLFHPDLGHVFMAHRPPKEEDVKNSDIVLCGHVHERWLKRGKYINVGVDRWAFRPASLSEIWTLQKFGFDS